MMCDICKRKIEIEFKKIFQNTLTRDYLLYIQEKLQYLYIQAIDKRTKIGQLISEENLQRLKRMLDDIEILIGNFVPYIEE
jgi:L-rhamnose mutarotase